MQYIVADLEWNGTYSKKAHGYYNEIVEIGAVKLNERLEETGTFHAVIKPIYNRKLTRVVSDLTNIGKDELEEGISFLEAAKRLARFVGNGPSVLLTWSTTDLSVLLENYRMQMHIERIPFMTHYADLQAYVQAHNKLGSASQQIGLSKACEALGISDEGFDQHRALDDSRMTAMVAQKTMEAEAFAPFIREADAAFYDRLNFKPYYISEQKSPLIARNHWRFRCPHCGRILRRRGEWRFYNKAFWCKMCCHVCDKNFTARAQFRKKYDSVEVKRKLTEENAQTAKDKQEESV